jgi:hypothetical protein
LVTPNSFSTLVVLSHRSNWMLFLHNTTTLKEFLYKLANDHRTHTTGFSIQEMPYQCTSSESGQQSRRAVREMNLWVEGSQATNLASLHLLWNLCYQTHCKELNRELFLLDSVVSPGGMDKAVPNRAASRPRQQMQ